MEGMTTLHALPHSEAPDFAIHAKKLKELERQADEITHRVNEELNRTFITPFDGEDMYALASAVDAEVLPAGQARTVLPVL